MSQIVQKEEPQAAAEISPVPRILPSIVEPMWGSSGAAEPVHRKVSVGEPHQVQMELALTTSASGDAKEAHSDVPETSGSVPQVDIAPEQDPISVQDTQPVQAKSAKDRSREQTRKASRVVEQVDPQQPMDDFEQTAGAELPWSPTLTSPKVVKRRLTKRQAASVQLPRQERWKRRLHPASW